MTPLISFSILAAYFAGLVVISYFTSKNATNQTFFTANRQSPWYLVAFGMIGATLSGVTFISIPGDVGNTSLSYVQIMIGYLIGYFIIGTVLLPLYYRLNLVSIYKYLDQRFGNVSYKTGSAFFMISQTIGASFRLFLVAGVMQIGFFDAFHIPFEATVIFTIVLIWLYTHKAGIKTIVWTDTFQTFFMLLSVVLTIFIIADMLHFSFSDIFTSVVQHEYSKAFFWDWRSDQFFVKQVLAGAFIAIVMTGLDQNMMQKNLTCRSLKESQKNMAVFSLVLVPVNLLFLSLGVLLYIFVQNQGIVFSNPDYFHFVAETGKYANTDTLFPQLAMNHFPLYAGIVFLIGIIAAAFSSADSALAALTTSFCVDFLGFNETSNDKKHSRTLQMVHIGFSVVMFLVIVLFKLINEKSVIQAVLKVAGYTYGPLLGLFAFGLFTKLKVRDKLVPYLAVLSPMLALLIDVFSKELFFGYKMGFEVLIINGLIMFGGLYAISKK